MASHSIDFVDEDNAGRVFLTLFEQIADATGAHANKHLDKIGTGDRKEGYVSLSGNRPSQQGFACSRGTHQQHALGNASAQLLEFLSFSQEFNDLAQFFLGLVHASYIFERDLLLLHREQSRTALAE